MNVKIPVLRIRLASDKELTTVHSNKKLYGDVEEMIGNLRMARQLSQLAEKQHRVIKIHLSLNSGEMSRDGFDMKVPATRDSTLSVFKLKLTLQLPCR